MPVPTNLSDLSTTAASNSPASTDTLSTTDDYLRAHASILAKISDGTNALVSPTITTLAVTTANATTVDTTNIEVTNIKAKDGTASATIADATGVMTVASAVLTTADINGGTADGVVIGGGTPAAATVTTLAATSGTVGGVAITTLTNTQTLTNKTLNLTSNTLTGTVAQFNTALSDGDFATLAGSETLTNKTITAPVINGTVTTTGLTLPAVTLGGAVTGNSQNISGLGTLGCGAITSSGAIAGTSLNIGTGALTAGSGTFSSRVIATALTANGAEAIKIIARAGSEDAQVAFYAIDATTRHSFLNSFPTGLDWYDNAGVKRVALSSTGLAVTGSLSCTGALSKGSGSFRIDHPLKPETHQLVHSFIEGPQADLLYRGKVNLTDGVAHVEIDAAAGMTEGTFVALCREVQVFTTNESGWNHVRGSVVGNLLTIECQDPTATDLISWMVIGERKDQHMMETDWTDVDGKVIVEPLKPVVESVA